MTKLPIQLVKLIGLSMIFLLVTACATSSSSYSANTTQAKSAKLLDDHKMELASIVAMSFIHYCKHHNWPAKNTLAKRNRKLAQSFITLQNYTDSHGIYHIRFKFKAPASSGLNATTNPEWLVSIPQTPSAEWTKAPVYVPVTIEGKSAGQKLSNIKSSQRFKAECQSASSWATVPLDQGMADVG